MVSFILNNEKKFINNIVSFIIMLVAPDNLSRTGTAVFIPLTILALQLTIADKVPVVGYYTLMDKKYWESYYRKGGGVDYPSPFALFCFNNYLKPLSPLIFCSHSHNIEFDKILYQKILRFSLDSP